jgi:hypothetical protein
MFDYNFPSNRVAAVGASWDSVLCQTDNVGGYCTFVIMYEGDNLDIKWSYFLDDYNYNTTFATEKILSFSDDGSLLAILSYQNFSVTVFNASTGTVRSSTSQTTMASAAINQNYNLPNIYVTGSAATQAEVYFQAYIDYPEYIQTIGKMIENPNNQSLDLAWMK